MTKRLIGTGVTDANGIVSMTYTGVGAGKLQIVAETGDISSVNYELIDAIWYDRGNQDNHKTWNSIVNIVKENGSLPYTDDYTVLEWNGNSTFGYIVVRDIFEDNSFVNIELDMKCPTSMNSNLITLRALGGGIKLRLRPDVLKTSDGEWHHIKISIRDLIATLEVDGVSIGDSPITDNTWYAFQLQVIDTNPLFFKNFVVY